MAFLEALIIKYGYAGIILLLMGGIIGLPIPDEVLLTFIGYYIYKEKMNYILSILSAFFGASLGITVSYFLGAKLGLPFLLKYGPKIHISHRKIAYTQKLFHRFGPVLLLFGFFIPGVRHITGYLSGIARYRYLKFATFAYFGSFIWVFIFITLGQELGNKWFLVERYLLKYSVFLVIFVLICAIAIYFHYRSTIKNKKKKI